MDKKAVTLDFVVGVIVCIVAAIVFMFLYTSSLNGAEKATPNTGATTGVTGSQALTAPPDAQTTYESIESSLTAATKSSSVNCIVAMKSFPTDFQKAYIELSNVSNGIFLQLVNSQNIVVMSTTILDPNPTTLLMPCIVAGDNNAAQNFYANYFKPSSTRLIPEYTEEGVAEITGPTSLTISSSTPTTGLISGTNYNLANTVLYKADASHVCFFTKMNSIIAIVSNANSGGLASSVIPQVLGTVKFCNLQGGSQ